MEIIETCGLPGCGGAAFSVTYGPRRFGRRRARVVRCYRHRFALIFGVPARVAKSRGRHAVAG